MSTFFATAIRRYALQMARFGALDGIVAGLDAAAGMAIDNGDDLPLSRLALLLQHLADHGPPDIALRCGSASRLSDMGIVGHAIASSRTLGAAMRIAIAHGAAGDQLCKVRYQTRGDDWLIHLRTASGLSPPVRRLVTEEWITAFFAHLTEVTGISRPQVRIELDHPAAPGVDYARWLPSSPSFGKRHSKLTLSAELLARRLGSYDNEMLDLILRHYAERPVAHAGVTDRVRRFMVLNETGPISLAMVAADIGTSVRTLVRRLTTEGTSFSKLLDESRRGHALALARDMHLRPKQISAALGYGSEQSFRRAFVGWTGQPLGQWRKLLRAEQRPGDMPLQSLPSTISERRPMTPRRTHQHSTGHCQSRDGR